MLNKLNKKLEILELVINNMKVDNEVDVYNKKSEYVYNKLCDVDTDLKSFILEVEELQDWVESGIKFLKE